MEIRKFIIELHTDGSMTWSEYTEPNSREDLNSKDLDFICTRTFQRAADCLKTLPWSECSPAARAAYLAGAARAAAILRETL